MKSLSIPVRVYYEDTDAGGIVYYANYLKYMERARTEWLRTLGFEQDALALNEGVIFAVRSASLDFVKPARFNDLLDVTATVRRQGGASLTFQQCVRRTRDTLCEAEIRIACVDVATFVPRPLPKPVRARLVSRTAS